MLKEKTFWQIFGCLPNFENWKISESNNEILNFAKLGMKHKDFLIIKYREVMKKLIKPETYSKFLKIAHFWSQNC